MALLTSYPNLTVGNIAPVSGTTNLGSNANITITGGTSGQVLSTNGSGNLEWVDQGGSVSTLAQQPMIQFTGDPAGGSGQVFVDPTLAAFTSNLSALVFVNGIQQQPADYLITGTTLTVTANLGPNAAVTVGPIIGGSGGSGGGISDIIANSVSSVAIPVAGGNVNTSVGGNANVFVVTSVGANLTGTLGVTGSANVTNMNVSGNATVNGNLTVSGNTNYVNTNTLQVEDPIIELGGGPNGAPLVTNDGKDRGTLLQYYTTQPVSAFMGWDNSNGEFALGSNVSVANDVVTFNSLGNLRINNMTGNAQLTTLGVSGTATMTNITSGGNTILNTLTMTGVSTLGPVANVRISGGLDEAVLSTNGAGNLSWYSIPQVRLPDVHWGFGRMHQYGNKLIRQGASGSGGRIYAFGLGYEMGVSTEYLWEDGGPASIVKCSGHNRVAYALDSTGVLWSMGAGNNGIQGTNTTTDRAIFGRASAPQIYGTGITVLNYWGVDDIGTSNADDAGLHNLLVHVNDNGNLRTYSVGINQNGCCGNGTTTAFSTMYRITQLDGKSIVDAQVSQQTIMVVTSTGEVWGAGYNTSGNLGIGNTTASISTFTRATLADTTFVNNAAKIIVNANNTGNFSTYILTTTGRVLSSGYNINNQLGDGTSVSKTRFVEVLSAAATPLTGIVKARHQRGGLAALDNLGRMWFTGFNSDGYWGDGSAAGANAGVYAAQKGTGVADFWTFTSYRSPASVAFYLDTATTNGQRLLKASGVNIDYMLGVTTAADGATVTTKQQVPLPRGEYPVQLGRVGVVDSGEGFWTGHHLVTNKNNYYVVGQTSNTPLVEGLGTVIRWFTLVTDYLKPTRQA